MDATYVKEMERLANEGRVIEKDGETFSPIRMYSVFYEPRPDALTVRTLTGLVDYLKQNRDGLDLGGIIAHVHDHGAVSILSPLVGKDRKRDVFLVAKFDGAGFRFDEFMASEKFIIAVNALFLPSSGRDDLLSFVSRLKIEDETTLTDSGVSQGATVRVGVRGGLTETQTAPSRIVLKPFRTFAEIDQPESEFVFRMQRSESGVKLALFEADGGAWKGVAQQLVASWIAENMGETPIAILA